MTNAKKTERFPDLKSAAATGKNVTVWDANLVPNVLLVEVSNIGDEENDEQDWVVDCGWAYACDTADGHRAIHRNGAWASLYDIQAAATACIDRAHARGNLERHTALEAAKEVIAIIEAAGLPVRGRK